MTKVYTLDHILGVLPEVDVLGAISQGFEAYAKGIVEVPPVGELLFPERNGELHIKYGAVKDDDTFVIKVATGFFDNPAKDLPPFGGCMMVLSQKTGEVQAVLLEEGELTNHRTAAAGAVAAKTLAPKSIDCIGIVGAGTQARLQADYLRKVTDCRKLVLWARNPKKAEQAVADIKQLGFDATVAESVGALCQLARLIVTTTPSNEPIISADMLLPGTHITAMGSDSPNKNELAPDVLAKADVVAVDSIIQCLSSGELHHAVDAGCINPEDTVELGAAIRDIKLGRVHEDQITIADLTGVACQDIAIATAVVDKLTGNGS